MNPVSLGSPDSPYLTADEACRYLRRTNVKAFYAAVLSERIPHRRAGRRLLFLREELDAWLAGETPRVNRRLLDARAVR